jgi:hypothetical protein
MCLLMAEILMLIGGLYALIAGRIKLSNAISLEGWQARIAGIILMVPLPLAFLTGALIGVLINTGALPPDVLGYASIIDILLVVGALAAALIYALIVQPKESDDTN